MKTAILVTMGCLLAHGAVASEPSIAEIQVAALRSAGLDPRAVDGMRSRAGLRALAPELEVAGGFSRSTLDENTINDEYSQTAPWILRGSSGDAWEVNGKLTWNLPELVFNPDELDAAALVSLQEARLRKVTRVYFQRRRALLNTTAADPMVRAHAQIDVEEHTAMLDALTLGWFTREAARRAGLPVGVPQ